MKHEVTYYIYDGYANMHGSPQHFHLDEEDIKNCDTREELEQLVEQEMKEHFEQKIEPFVEDSEIDELEAIRTGSNTEDADS